jgi:hypothetical protein
MPDPLTVEQIDLVIDAAAQGLAEVTVDGQTVKTRPLSELMEWRRLAEARASRTNGVPPVRFTRLIPPGTS